MNKWLYGALLAGLTFSISTQAATMSRTEQIKQSQTQAKKAIDNINQKQSQQQQSFQNSVSILQSNKALGTTASSSTVAPQPTVQQPAIQPLQPIQPIQPVQPVNQNITGFERPSTAPSPQKTDNPPENGGWDYGL